MPLTIAEVPERESIQKLVACSGFVPTKHPCFSGLSQIRFSPKMLISPEKRPGAHEIVEGSFFSTADGGSFLRRKADAKRLAKAVLKLAELEKSKIPGPERILGPS